MPTIDADRGGKDYVFSLDGEHPIQGFGKLKARLDDNMLALLRQDDPEAVLPDWQHRDLRRTARTLMARAKVSREIAEHCLGHVLGGVEGIYNRHDYMTEKRDAFEKLAAMIDRILNPPEGNVVHFRTA